MEIAIVICLWVLGMCLIAVMGGLNNERPRSPAEE